MRKAIQEIKERLEQLERKDKPELREILETQDLLDLEDKLVRRETPELLALVLLLKVRIILTRN